MDLITDEYDNEFISILSGNLKILYINFHIIRNRKIYGRYDKAY